MTGTKQPEALRLADAIDPFSRKNAPDHLTSKVAADELRRLHAENTALQAGYAAARLEIESLRARSAEPVGESPALPEPDTHCFDDDTQKDVWSYSEGLVRSILASDRAMRAEQPAGAQQTGTAYAALPDKGLTPELTAALQRGADGVFDLLKDWHLINKDAKAGRRLWQIGRNLEGIFGCALRGDYTRASHGQAPAQAAPAAVAGPGAPGMQDAIRQYTEAQDALDNREYAGINAEPYDKLLRARNAARRDLEAALAAAPTAQPAPQQEAQEPVAWLDPWTGAKVTTDYDAYGKHGIPLYTAPQPQPTSRGDALDAARYRYLRDVPMGLWPAELLSAIRLQQNAKWDAAIDAARAAQEGGQ